ncbi:MAG: hypothetical protein JJT82_04330 [Legionellaceae bacterium]|nr:hypothetical protein [Legionellaceae bacterium]
MPPTKYETYKGSLDTDRITRDISSSGSVIAKGVSAPYEGAQTPCVAATFNLKEPALQYVFTDALTGCAGFIAVSGDISQNTGTFKAANALVIHDKGGDALQSSQILLEDFFMEQKKNGHHRMRLIWGNGVVHGNVDQSHTRNTKAMVSQLAQDYPHLDIKHLPKQMALVIDTQGNPVNLSDTSWSNVARMETLLEKSSAHNIPMPIDVHFERSFQADFITDTKEQAPPNPKEQVNDALHEGKFPPIWLIQSDEKMTLYLKDKTASIPMSGGDSAHYNELTDTIKKHPDTLVQEIGKQLDHYKLEYVKSIWGTSKSPKKAELMSRKWWAMMFLATESMQGLQNQPARKQLFDKNFYTVWVPRSMEGSFSKTAASLVEKTGRQFIFFQKIDIIDGSKKPDETHAHSTAAPIQQISSPEPTKFKAKP